MAALWARRVTTLLLQLLALVLVGTVIVLSLVRAYFHVEPTALIVATELGTWDEIRADRRPSVLDGAPTPAAGEAPAEKIPRIIHQTWKTNELPPHWAKVREHCRAMMPDYEYHLWTDESARAFIAEEYPWFLKTYDDYPYNIQRADAIRYFVLHHFGGVYMDLDIGCRRRLDSLLRFEAIVPRTIPIGVSNDLMFSMKGHPYMTQLIESLAKFQHYYLTHYATVMFSTGPMFVSAMLRAFSSTHDLVHASTPDAPEQGFVGVRVLPKSLYGKNLQPEDAPDAFFEHLYGSSWHANDAGLMIFLRIYGRYLLAAGALIVLIGLRHSCINAAMRVARVAAPVLQLLGVGRETRAPENEWIFMDETDDETKASLVANADGADRPLAVSYDGAGPSGAAQAPLPTPWIEPPRASGRPRRSVDTSAGLTASGAADAASMSATRAGLPTFYIESAHEEGGRQVSLDAGSTPLTSAEPAWRWQDAARALPLPGLRAMVPPPMRAHGGAAAAPDAALTSVDVDKPSSRLRVGAATSEEDHAEWAHLVAQWDSGLRSPSPQLISGPSESPTSTAHVTELLRRPQTLDPRRAMTPNVPYLPGETDPPGPGLQGVPPPL